MDAIELLELVSLGETSTVQFERTAESPDQLAAELCAFANTAGGRLLIGVEDDGTIGGLDPQSLRRINSLVADVASNSIREPLYPVSQVVTVKGKHVLVVAIAESESKPHFDRQGAIWLKTTSDKRRVTSREELRRFFRDSPSFYPDQQPVHRTSLTDLDRPLLEEFLRNQYSLALPDGGELLTLLDNLNIARAGSLTLASQLLPYRRIGTGVRRALKSYPSIEFVNDLETNSFRAVIARSPEPSPAQPLSPSLTDT